MCDSEEERLVSTMGMYVISIRLLAANVWVQPLYFTQRQLKSRLMYAAAEAGGRRKDMDSYSAERNAAWSI